MELGVSMLILSFLLYGAPVAKADIVTYDGIIAAHQPYIISPSNYITYYSESLTLNVSFLAEVWGNVKYTVVYSLDGQQNEPLPTVDHYYPFSQGLHNKSYVDGSVILPELSEGSHTITVYLECDWAIGYSTGWEHHYYYDNETVYFTVKNTDLPSPTPSPIPSPTPTPTPTQTSKPTQSPEPQPEPLPTTIVIATSVIIAVSVLVLFVYDRKRKQNTYENSMKGNAL